MLKLPVDRLVAGQDSFGYHVATDGTEIVVKVSDDEIDLPLGVIAAFFKSLRDLFEDDKLFLSLRWDAL